MKRLLMFLALFLSLGCSAQAELDGSWLAGAWDEFQKDEVASPDGATYLSYITGVLQGTAANSTLFDHVPNMPTEKMAYVIGVYIDKHRLEPEFAVMPAAFVVTKAILAKYPEPKVEGLKL